MRTFGPVLTASLLFFPACGDDGASTGDTTAAGSATAASGQPTASGPTASEPTASEPTAGGATNTGPGPTTSTAGSASEPTGEPTVTAADATSVATSDGPSTGPATADATGVTTDATTDATTDVSTEATGDATTDVTAGTTDTSNPDAPAPLTDLDVDPTNAANYVSWDPPDDPDLAGVLVLRRAGAPVVAVPADGTVYNPGDVLGDSDVIYASDGANLLDAPLTNGTTYHYRLYAYDVAANYAVGVSGSGTPYDPHPSGYTSYKAIEILDEIQTVHLALDSADRPHLALSVTKNNQDFVHYARCTGACAGPEDWTITQIANAVTTSNTGPRIALDAQDRPRIAFRAPGSVATFLACNQTCDVSGNWTSVAVVPEAGETSLAIDETGASWMFVAGKPTRFTRCTNGCSNPANWTTSALPLDSSYLHEGSTRSDRVALPLAYWNGANYELRLFSCTGDCTDPALWTVASAGSTQGSVGRSPYRIDAWGGAQFTSSHLRRYYACKDCAPGLPPLTLNYTNEQLYNDGLLELSAEGHARVLATKSSGKYHYMTCDYDCDVAEQWIEQPALDAADFVCFRLASDGMPVIVHAPYAETHHLLYKRGLGG